MNLYTNGITVTRAKDDVKGDLLCITVHYSRSETGSDEFRRLLTFNR